MNQIRIFIFIALLPTFTLAETLVKERVVKVSIDAEYAPYEFVDKDQKVSGFLPALLREIGRSTGIKFQFYPMSWPEAMKSLQNGEVDLVNMIHTSSRDLKFEFSDPHSVIEQAIFRHKQYQEINSIDSISQHIVILQYFDIAMEMLEKRNDFVSIMVNSRKEGFIQLNENRAAAFFTAYQPGLYILNNNKLDSIEVAQSGLWTQNFCFTAKKGNTEIIKLLNQELTQIKSSGRYNELYQQWMLKPKSWLDQNKHLAAIIGIITLLAIVIISLWILGLKRLVKISTKELQSINKRFSLAADLGGLSIWEWDLISNKIQWDKKGYQLFGLEADDFIVNFENWLSCIHPEDLDYVTENINLAIQGKKLEINYRIIHPDGEIVFIQTKAVASWDKKHQNIIALTGISKQSFSTMSTAFQG